VSDSEVLVIFVTPDGDVAAIYISEWHKIMYRTPLEMEHKRGN